MVIKKRMVSIDDEDNGAVQIVTPETGVSCEERMDLQQAIDLLPEKQRIVITLKYFDEMKIDEIAYVLRIPSGSVKAYLNRARTSQTDLPSIDGDFIDEYTYTGVIRFDLNQKITDTSEYAAAREKALEAGEEWDDGLDAYGENEKTVEVPDSFTLDLNITQIHGALKDPDIPDFGKTAEELDAMSEDERHAYMTNWYQENPDWAEMPNEHQDVIFNGNWEFTIEVNKNAEDTQVVEVNDVNELGIGIEKVVKDRFEITMYDKYTEGAHGADYFPVMLDADGILMDYGSGSSVNTVAINDCDVSRVDIFLVDYYKWMGELKGDKWRHPGALTDDGRTYRELLMEECAYHTEVIFGE